ncbi:MAG: hypothetical protein ACTH7Q_09640 [Pseudoalteromonas sp.]|uniref:hypothetical protein n=1 Tax=unclassified Pseudoalteromonas TaxID=194690 RepID=UPI003F9D2FB3
MKNRYALLLFITTTIYSNIALAQVKTDHDWQLIDNFELNTLAQWQLIDTDNQTKPRVKKPQITTIKTEQLNKTQNNFLLKKPAKDGLIGNRKALSYLKLPNEVENGQVYTFYIRINVAAFPNNHAFGLSNLAPDKINKQGYDSFEPTLRITDKMESNGFKNTGALMVKTDQGYKDIISVNKQQNAKPMSENQWYEVWYVVNNKPHKQGGQRYDVYIKGGEFSTQTLAYKNADFRMKREKPLKYFLANCNTGPHDNPYGNGGLRYDDLYMVQGINLTSPI